MPFFRHTLIRWIPENQHNLFEVTSVQNKAESWIDEESIAAHANDYCYQLGAKRVLLHIGSGVRDINWWRNVRESQLRLKFGRAFGVICDRTKFWAFNFHNIFAWVLTLDHSITGFWRLIIVISSNILNSWDRALQMTGSAPALYTECPNLTCSLSIVLLSDRVAYVCKLVQQCSAMPSLSTWSASSI